MGGKKTNATTGAVCVGWACSAKRKQGARVLLHSYFGQKGEGSTLCFLLETLFFGAEFAAEGGGRGEGRHILDG
jgi:hypothetical protein